MKKVTLCCAKGCPDVIFNGKNVLIGENGQYANLKKDEWNLLVDYIQNGKLTKI